MIRMMLALGAALSLSTVAIEASPPIVISNVPVEPARVCRDGRGRFEKCPVPAPPPPLAVWTKCADEGGICHIVGMANVRYGAGTAWATKSAMESIACSNDVFGDPIFGTVKSCETDGRLAPPPTPPPVPAPVIFPTVSSVSPIADNFNTADALQPAWGSGVLPGSMGADPVGAFRMICGAGQISYDDPIVYPGQPGKSHLHQFYGNTAVDANTTFASLRANGGSTCGDPSLPYAVNRSGYWMPAMLDGAGHVVKPMYVAIYYKRIPASDPRCDPGANPTTAIGKCVAIPTALRWITGYNFQNGIQDAHALFYCQGSADGMVKSLDDNLRANSMVPIVPVCPVGARLTLNIDGPDCWDGVNLDSADHRTHVSHSRYFTNANNVGVQQCDAAHPYHMPAISIIAIYTTDANFAAGKWHLSSDDMVSGALAGSTFHADYWEAWSPSVRDGWTRNCIDAHMSCQGGELGDGTQIKGMTVPNTQVLVPVPARPSMTMMMGGERW